MKHYSVKSYKAICRKALRKEWKFPYNHRAHVWAKIGLMLIRMFEDAEGGETLQVDFDSLDDAEVDAMEELRSNMYHLARIRLTKEGYTFTANADMSNLLDYAVCEGIPMECRR